MPDIERSSVDPYDVAVELSNLADAQLDGLGALTGRAGRDRMRVLLNQLDAYAWQDRPDAR